MDDQTAWTLLAGGVAAILGAIAVAIRAGVSRSSPTTPQLPQPGPVDQSGTYPAVQVPVQAQVVQALEPFVARIESSLAQVERPATQADIRAMQAEMRAFGEEQRRSNERYEELFLRVEENQRGVHHNADVNARQDRVLDEHGRALENHRGRLETLEAAPHH